MKDYFKVGPLSQIPKNSGLSFRKGDYRVAIFNVDGAFFATDDACPHRGAPLGDGPVHDGIVTCTWHGWEFDIKKGCLVGEASISLKKYDVRIQKNQLFVAKAPMGSRS